MTHKELRKNSCMEECALRRSQSAVKRHKKITEFHENTSHGERAATQNADLLSLKPHLHNSNIANNRASDAC